LFDAKFSAGGNRLYGGAGNDDVLLGSGDLVVGDEGSDRFFTYYGGNNTITGGEGADEFWLANGQLPDSPNTIADFQAGIDVLGINGLGLTFNNLSLTQEGGNTIVFVGNSQLAILQGIESSSLSEANFAFE
jgi:Ca2+-binding RTX toxin-like protein